MAVARRILTCENGRRGNGGPGRTITGAPGQDTRSHGKQSDLPTEATVTAPAHTSHHEGAQPSPRAAVRPPAFRSSLEAANPWSL